MPISRPRSGAEIAGIPRGSSEKQIFGNCVLPENRANQILARLLLESRFLLLHESPVGGLQILLGIVFRPHSPFRQSDQGTAHRKMALFRNAPDCARERRGNGNAMADRLRRGGAVSWFCSAYFHVRRYCTCVVQTGSNTELAGGPKGYPACPTWGRPVSYTHLRAHETRHDLVCRLLLE